MKMMKKMMMVVGVVSLCQTMVAGNTPVVVSSRMRESDPTVMDVVYKVVSDQPTVNVRALAFEDGERSFWKVVRPETFIEGTAANIDDNIAANVEHRLAWKVASDWKTDLAKVKFEILTSDMAQLPLKTVTIPQVGNMERALTVYCPPATSDRYGRVSYSQIATNCFNALLWHYADAADDLVIEDGYPYWLPESAAKTVLSKPDEVINVPLAVTYIYEKMGLIPLSGVLQNFVKETLRKEVWFNTDMQCAVKQNELPTSLYIGEKAYWWIDLTNGTNGYLDSVPLAGWGDEYKTTKLLMRRIEPGDVRMGDTKPVTITNPYYIGVFQVTQKQYELINGSNPSSYKGDLRPVECVSYNDIRGTSKGAQWPNGTEFDASSWLGKLSARVGIAFDLPTESQWEYACRAGTTSYLNNNGNSSDYNMSLLGRYSGNRSDGKGGYSEHTTVGSYLANGWGLYDMHGNVWEWCLDWYGSLDSYPMADWAGAVSGSDRVRRGGYWNSDSSNCWSSSRYDYYPSSRSCYYGFRLCCSAPAGLH